MVGWTGGFRLVAERLIRSKHMTNKTLTLGSLFDGSGGFPLGGLLAGITPVWASEIEPFPIRVTTKRLPFMKHYGNISAMDGGKIEPVDIITFGSPCQDMSIAGRRDGLDGSRSSLFYEAVRIIKEMRCATDGKYPRWICWENVPGAFSSNKGEDFKAVLEAVIGIAEPNAQVPMPEKARWPYADLYMGDGWSVAYRTLDAQYWGVPQRRRRIYLVADLAGRSAGKILFESEGLSGYSAEGFRSWQRAAGSFTPCAGATGFDGYNGSLTEDTSATLGVNCGTSTGRNGIVLNDQGGGRMEVSEDVAATLRAETHGHPPCVIDEQMPHGKRILDVTCGMRGIWFNKNHPDAIYCDVRNEEYHIPTKNGGMKNIVVKPDVICDFTNLPFRDDEFNLVVFDPPHVTNLAKDSLMGKLYTSLDGAWKRTLHDGFCECMRVLRPGGVLIFKWSEVEISTGEIIHVFGQEPLFGHKSGKKMNTHWLCFMKETEVVPLENHPIDSRITMADDGKVQTLTSRMGTGGNNVPLVMKIRSGCKGGGKGPLIQKNKSATLSCNNDQTLFEPCGWDGGQVSPTLTKQNAGGNQRMPDKNNFTCVLQPFGICSKDSNAMKSDNPHSGIYEAETARTLDGNGGNPSCNQGGIAVVAFTQNQRDEVRDLGDHTSSVCANAGMKQQTYVLQGSMIGREDKNGPQGDGINEDVSFTLNTVDRHAVYSMTMGSFTQVSKEKAPTVLARDYKDPTAVCYGIGRDTFNQGQNAKFAPTFEKELQPTLVAKGPGAIQSGYTVRRLTPIECARLQGFPDNWCADLGTEKPTDEEMYFWHKVFKTYSEVTGCKMKSDKQIAKWLRNPYSDSAEYKMWGNGVALPCVWFVLCGIVWYAQLCAENDPI